MANKPNLFKRGDIYYIRYRVKGKLIVQSLGTKLLREAEQKRKEILLSAKDVKTESDVIHKVARAKEIYNPVRFSLSHVVKTFETHPSWEKPSEQTMQAYRHWIQSFINWLESNHPEITYISAVTTKISKEYSIHLSSTGISNKTYNEVLNCLSRVFKVLKEVAGINVNPFVKDFVARLSKKAISRKELSKEQVNTLLNSFREIKDIPFLDEYELLFYIGVYTGMRLKDGCLFKWEDVSFSQNFIKITPYKTKRFDTKVEIPIHEFLLSKLREAKKIYRGEYVLPNVASEYESNRDRIHDNIRKIFAYSGYKATVATPNVQRKLLASQYSFHSLRYAFVSICAECGIPQFLVQEVVGHLNPAMTEHYTKTSKSFKREEFKKYKIALPSPKDLTIKENILKRIETASEATLQRIYTILEAEGGKNE